MKGDMKNLIVFWALILTIPVFGQSKSKERIPELLSINERQVTELKASWKGNVVLVNLWATWCGPCIKEFPDLIKLQKLYEKQGVKVIFISVDEPEAAETDVRPFLQKQKVTFTTYIKNGDDDSFIDAVGTGWRGAIPTTFIFDRTGKQVATLIGARDFKTFEGVIRPHLQ
jgi:thiol-disulfide isomerase/thioredoxin